MDNQGAGPRALGAYRGPWLDAVLPLLSGSVLLFTGLAGNERNWWSVGVGALVLTLALIPATLVRRSGVVLLYRFRRIPWSDVVAIQEIDFPGSKECLRVRRRDGRIFVLRGIPGARLPGLIQLAGETGRDRVDESRPEQLMRRCRESRPTSATRGILVIPGAVRRRPR